ncbi:hypothetical protein BST81_02735 [Leptolyngbya sp. 'hensonii']|uniref:SpoIID/LytB domain-containing protein n=1 Tax=Leptolyngbya sp. 'hensonii' TaxID=1922337 RepID=UPI0009503548|nr:SpoIID/LytB domain-containing protein [Leptolyngbya sp. 'hensonii']OLP20006.1 hypothetical protein BST81_02735 [Leptolyngbya sp. 'hensonii']
MFRPLAKHRIFKIFKKLGPWSVPVLSLPLLLPLVLAESMSQPLQPVGKSLKALSASVLTEWMAVPQFAPTLFTLNGQILAANSALPQQGRKIGQEGQVGSAVARQSGQSQKQMNAQRSVQPTPVVRQAVAPVGPTLELQVKVAEGAVLPVSTSTKGIVVDDSGRVLRGMQAMQPVYAQPGSQGINLNSWDAPTSIWIEASEGGFVFVGEHWYRGRVRLVLIQDSIVAVNHVDLEDYLPSVVGSEMYHDWSIEALKAQAVAARSYALVHYIRPAGTYYQIGSDEYFQVYKGLDSEAPSTREAVLQTTGQVLSYRGGVVESLYAASDDLVLEAHKGVGMSQEGAQKLASQGYSYLQILGNYYPGTTLAQLKPYQP